MDNNITRKDFLKLAGLGGVAFASGLGTKAWAEQYAADDFYFVQLSDSHWGFTGDKINPEAKSSLKKAVAAVNALKKQPDFVVFTGDLTDLTEDEAERKKRMSEFKEIIAGLKTPKVYFMPGEHDGSLDQSAVYKRFFGETRYAFDHKGVHFVALDNVSDPHGALGDEQLKWLEGHLRNRDRKAPLVVLTHRPLWDVAPAWDWDTKDGAKAIELLLPFEKATVFYGHIHQENHHMTEHIAHHSAQSLMWPLPAPMSVPKKMKIPWDPAHPFAGLGFREVLADVDEGKYTLDERRLGA